MDHFQYFHFCDHRFPLTNGDAMERTVTIDTDGTSTQVLVDKARILDIIEVKVMEFDPPILVEQIDYSQYAGLPLPTTFYSPYLHNRIRWLVPNPPKKYTVQIQMLPIQTTYKENRLEGCPRCQGKAWFVDILNQDGQFVVPAGIERVAQRALKDLLTEAGSNIFDGNYGKLLEQQTLRRSSDSDERLFDEIRLIVSEVEDEYLTRQAADAESLPDDETLVRLTCSKVFRSPKRQTQVIVEITLQTRVESRTLRMPI